MIKEYKVIWSDEAIYNLRDIHDYIKELNTLPTKYKVHQVLKEITGKDYRYKTVKNRFIVVYLIKEKSIEILKVFNGSQSIGNISMFM